MTDKLKLCFISDTHNTLSGIVNFIPECDYLIHCGDSTNFGTVPELAKVNDELGIIRARGVVKKDIIIIGGNHDFQLEKDPYLGKNIFTNATYVENNTYTMSNGMTLYGSPITPKFYNWAFMKHRGEQINKYWLKIPDNIDILVTHGPPFGILDLNHLGENCGCEQLRDRIKQLKNLKIHAWGHIHESHATIVLDDIRFINAATMGKGYKHLNPPICVDI